MIELTPADISAIAAHDHIYINGKGAKFYVEENYEAAVEYYRLGAAMGDLNSISNLGYCYLYGRHIEQNIQLAIAYFKIAASRKCVEAAYKLGDIYSREKWGVMDKEMSNYYYTKAASYIIGADWLDPKAIQWSDDLEEFPSLCFALGREMSLGGSMGTDVETAYIFLMKAKAGYEMELADGVKMYQESYDNVIALMADPQFDLVRKKYDDDDED